jgi:ParB family chromosome partitioning protein
MFEKLDLLNTPADLLIGSPMLLLVESIDEDPDQPRKEFDQEKLAELAETIRLRGVRQPVSVRRHPVHADRWVLNFGARRLRASRLVGKTDIPAFVDNSPDSYDQVIENEQRENLTPLDLALFVKRRLAAGETQAEIARQMGKSRAFVTMACSMIDPPDAIMVAYRSGRCRGLTELYQLRKLHEQQPDLAESLVDKDEPISRAALASLARPAADPSLHATPVKAPVGSREIAVSESIAPGSAEAGRASIQLELALEADQICTRLALIIQQLSADRSEAVAARVAGLRERLSWLAARPGSSP